MKTKIILVAVLICAALTGCAKNENENTLSQTDLQQTVTENVAENVQEETQQNTQTDVTELAPDVQDEETPEIVVPEIPEENVAAETDGETDKTEQVPVQRPMHVSVTGIKLTTYDVGVCIGQKTMPIVTMSPYNASDKGEIWQSSDEAVATVDGIGNITGVAEGKCVVTVTSTDNPEVSASVNVTVIPNPECTYINGILIANKTYPLPQSYAPGWDAEASDQLHVMFAAAKQDGINLFVKSGYRSYIDQKIIYNGYVARDGKEAADRYSARPGHSEHQTGLAFDLNSTANSFAGTPEAIWIAENSYKYGFIIRYPEGKEHITGYIYEPWHVRYLGVEKAKEVFDSGLCLEEFLGITSVYSY